MIFFSSFIIELFNNLLKYNDKEIFIIIDINNDIWLKMKDIFSILGYNNTRKAVQNTSIDKNYKKKYKYIKVYDKKI